MKKIFKNLLFIVFIFSFIQLSTFAANNNDLYKAKNLLKTLPMGSTCYKVLDGQNKTNKEFILEYKNLSDLDKRYTDYFALAYLKEDRLYMYVNTKYASEPLEAISTIMAGCSICDDSQYSITEGVFQMIIYGGVWEDFLVKKPDLQYKDTPMVRYLNYCRKVLKEEEKPGEVFKAAVLKNNPDLPLESPGYTSELGVFELTNKSKYKSSRTQMYKDFYYIQTYDPQGYFSLKMVLKTFPKEEMKKWSKVKQKNYKKCLSYEKKIRKGKTIDILKYHDSSFLPALVAFHNYNYDIYKKNYNHADINCKNMLYCINQIYKYDLDFLFDKDEIQFRLCRYNWYNDDYKAALKYAYPLRNKWYKEYGIDDEYYYLTWCIADSQYHLNNYKLAIQEANKIDKKYRYYYSNVVEILYFSYYRTNNNNQANLIIMDVLKSHANDIWYYRASSLAKDVRQKLYYLYKAKYFASNKDDKYFYNFSIFELEDKFLLQECNKKIVGYYDVPQWTKIMKNVEKYINVDEYMSRGEYFYKKVKECTKKYSGNNLRNALNTLKENEEKANARIIEDYRFREMQYLEVQRINELRRMNANLMYSNSLQERQNYYLQQQNRPRNYQTNVINTGNGNYYMHTTSY